MNRGDSYYHLHVPSKRQSRWYPVWELLTYVGGVAVLIGIFIACTLAEPVVR